MSTVVVQAVRESLTTLGVVLGAILAVLVPWIALLCVIFVVAL